MSLDFIHYLSGIVAGAEAGTAQNISLDFERGSSQSLSMTDANFGAFNRAKFAISVWVKRESIGLTMLILSQRDAPPTDTSFHFGFNSSNKIFFEVSSTGGAFDGQLETTAAHTSTTAWQHILVWYDSANATAGDRMRMWVDGSEVTAFATDVNPTAAAHNSALAVVVGDSGFGDYFDGLMYQLAFFSGTLPDISTLYNAGRPMNISGLGGLYAHLNVPGGDVDNDAVLAADWTNNNAVTAAAIIP